MKALTLRVRNDLLEGVRREADTISVEKLVLELDPVKTKGVKEALEHIHHEQDTKGDTGKHTETKVGSEPVDVEGGKHSLLPENSGELGVSKGQSPETEVGSSVGNHTKNELNGLNSLVDENFSKSVLIVFVIVESGVLFIFSLDVVVNWLVTLALAGQQVRLGKKEDWNGTKRNEKENVLDSGLPSVDWLVDVTWLKGNVD
jgi:hypothetical protein